jgi:hypothetical protein
MAPPLAHHGHDHRQIPLLMRDRVADPLLAAGEPVPAAAPLRQAVHRPGRQLLGLGRRPARSLMAGLRALLAPLPALTLQLLLRALTRQRTALLPRQRRIRRRCHRAVARRPVQPPLELLNSLHQPDQQLTRGLPARQRDRFRLHSIHERKIPPTNKEPCSPPRHHVNTYKR